MLKEPVGDLRNSLGIGLSRFGVGRWTRQTLRGCIPSLVIHGTTSGGRINTPMHQTAITADVVSSLVLHPGVGMGCVCGSFHALIPYGKSFFVGTSESKHQVIFVL